MSYIGQGLGQGQAERFVFTASGGETSVTLDDAGRGVAYTVGQVDVYLNGVKLVNGTDFTATSGSSITGLSALTASDVVEIVALDAFSPADTVSASTGGTFTGNVDFDGTVDIAGATTTADVTSTKSAAAVSTLNRTTSDGDIQVFKKDGTTVGNIGSDTLAFGNGLFIGNGDTGVIFQSQTNNAIEPYNISSSAIRDSGISLGSDTARFQSLYLSGGVYLGGTGAANYLDDYEAGTWTPTAYGGTSTGTTTYGYQYGTYTKIGNIVTVSFSMRYTALTGTGELRLGGLPFAVNSNNSTNVHIGSIMSEGLNWDVSTGSMVVMGTFNQTYMRIGFSQDDAALSVQSCVNESVYLWGSLTYRT
jgi:hypothetical protein